MYVEHQGRCSLFVLRSSSSIRRDVVPSSSVHSFFFASFYVTSTYIVVSSPTTFVQSCVTVLDFEWKKVCHTHRPLRLLICWLGQIQMLVGKDSRTFHCAQARILPNLWYIGDSPADIRIALTRSKVPLPTRSLLFSDLF